MNANLYEQTKELSVLRAIGFKRVFIVKIYIYEAIVIVLSSSFLGVLIGIILGYTMALQKSMFDRK
jgi:ABC-type antimicrobial peptide transport system permease subunit